MKDCQPEIYWSEEEIDFGNKIIDEFVGGDLLVELVVGVLVKQDQVVQLVPGLSLGPLLLLGLATAASLLLLGVLGGGLGILLRILFGSHVCK